jgi:hypothetical protein
MPFLQPLTSTPSHTPFFDVPAGHQMFASDTRQVFGPVRRVFLEYHLQGPETGPSMGSALRFHHKKQRDTVRTVSHHVRYASSSASIVWFHPALRCSSLERKIGQLYIPQGLSKSLANQPRKEFLARAKPERDADYAVVRQLRYVELASNDSGFDVR